MALQTDNFKKVVKKLQKNQKAYLDKAIRALIESPALGVQKKGDLSFLRVYKFKMVKQFTLLGYSYQDNAFALKLIALGSRSISVKISIWSIEFAAIGEFNNAYIHCGYPICL